MKISRFIAFVLCVILFSSNVLAEESLPRAGSFTHPEVGEFMTIEIDNHLASFQIYGFTYYRIIPYEEPYRGLLVNAPMLINDNNATLEQSLNNVFDCVDGTMEGYAPLISFSYTGFAQQFEAQLNALSREDRIKALRILGGFDGKEGYQAINQLPGFENVDISTMSEQYQEFYVQVGGVRYPYRVMMFFFEEEDWYEYYNERYHYIHIDNEWKLVRITKEYSDEYSQRSKYIHGMEGSDPSLVVDTNNEALRATAWGMSIDEVSKRLNVQADGETITLEKNHLYRVPADLSFHFSENKLDEIVYAFSDEQQYFSIFVSLYIRYFDPTEIDADGDITWYQNDMRISLTYDESAPTLTFSPIK